MDHIEGTIVTLKKQHEATSLEVAKITRSMEQAQRAQLEAESPREKERTLLSKSDADPEEGAYIAARLHDLEERINSVRHYLQTMKTTMRETDIVASFRRERLVNEQARQEAERRLSEATAELGSHEALKPEAGWWSNVISQCHTTLGRVRKRLQSSLTGTKMRPDEGHHLIAWSRFVSHTIQSLLKPVIGLEKGLERLQSRLINNSKAMQWHRTYRHLQAKASDAKRGQDIAWIKWRKAAKTVAKRFGVPKRLVHLADRITADGIRKNREEYAQAVNSLNDLMTKKSEWGNKQTKHQRQREEYMRRKRMWEATQAKSDAAYKEKLQGLQRSQENKHEAAAVYSQRIAADQASRGDFAAQYAALGADVDKRAHARELFAFWDTAFSKRRTADAASGAETTFRAYVLEQSLGEVNVVATEILAGLYQDTRHARDTAAGMLKSIFASTIHYDGGDDESPRTSSEKGNDEKGEKSSSAPRLLDSTSLGVTPALAYAKRSGGERKRIDLALFFALVLVGQGRGAHRARYLLVDEVFDSLDPAGQAAVARWCRYLLARVDFVAVVTHSELLLRLAAAEADEGKDGGRGQVVWRARIGEEGEGTVVERGEV
ncbi:hypothetical protein PG994_012623 [Apiospora phragmitis]|uniref:RecF/RecN/SMC N-terminal domain-containing protein n=1 Tax=Apiospora phragmitis TaxID=2905665 RepID=A0ABR1TAZ3_9PEZI